jgi:LPXTG-motif cell wall-anchored protein
MHVDWTMIGAAIVIVVGVGYFVVKRRRRA